MSIPPYDFTVSIPSITAITPSSGPIGVAFTLTGQSFGPYNGGLTQVLINGATVPLSVWNDTSITGTVPGGLTGGTYPVITERLTSDGGLAASNTVYFQVVGPSSVALSPSSGPIGIPFANTRTNNGTYD